MKRTVVLMLVMAFAFTAPAFANQILDNAESDDYVVKAPAMLLRGIGNVVLSPVELLESGYSGTIEGRPLVGTLEGVGNGIFYMLDRAGRGAWDILTFWAPKISAR